MADSPAKEFAPRRQSESVDFISDVVGDEALCGKRLQTHAVLDLLDICAGRFRLRVLCRPENRQSFSALFCISASQLFRD